MKRSEELIRTIPSERILERALDMVDDLGGEVDAMRAEWRARKATISTLVGCGIDPQRLLNYANAAHMANVHTVTISSTELAIIARALGAMDERP